MGREIGDLSAASQQIAQTAQEVARGAHDLETAIAAADAAQRESKENGGSSVAPG